MPLLEQEYKVVPLDAVTPHPRNANQGDVGAISESMKANRVYGAILVQKSTGLIIKGNHTWYAARANKEPEIPVFFVDVDDETATRILLVDNRTSDLRTYDKDQLAELLEGLSAATGSLTGTGFDMEFLDDLLAEIRPLEMDIEKQDGQRIPTFDPLAPTEDFKPPMASTTRQIMLILTEDQTTEFLNAVEILKPVYGTDNVTDTVIKALEDAQMTAEFTASEGFQNSDPYAEFPEPKKGRVRNEDDSPDE